jgi:hypothetical protein
MHDVSSDTEWMALTAFFPLGWEDVLRKHGVVTDAMNAKLCDPEVAMRLMLFHVGTDAPLRQSVAALAAAGGPDLSPMRLHKKMQIAVPAFAEMVASMLAPRIEKFPETWGGFDVYLLDGSVVASPGPSGRGGRLHIVLRASTLEVVDARISGSYECGETLRNFKFGEGKLVVVDRGYSSPVGIAHVRACGGHVLARLNRGTLPLFDAEGRRVDVLSWLRDLRGIRAESRVAYAHDGDTRVQGRLVARRLPEPERNKARATVAKNAGTDVDAEQLEFAEYWIAFTTVSSEALTDNQILELYRLRWQVELLFKRWKSLSHLDDLRNIRADNVVAWLHIKLFLALVSERVEEAARANVITSPGSSKTEVVAKSAATFSFDESEPIDRTGQLRRRQPWKLRSLVWPVVAAATLFFSLGQLIDATPRIVENLERYAHLAPPRGRPTQIFTYRHGLGSRVAITHVC